MATGLPPQSLMPLSQTAPVDSANQNTTRLLTGNQRPAAPPKNPVNFCGPLLHLGIKSKVLFCKMKKRRIKHPKPKCDPQSQRKEQLKATILYASYIRIGSWQVIPKNKVDLVVKFYFATRKLVWEVAQEDGLTKKIEIRWLDIDAIRATLDENKPGVLQVQLIQPPTFYKLKPNSTPRHHAIWIVTEDFTSGQASNYRQHHLEFPEGVLDEPYSRLLYSDRILLEASQRAFADQADQATPLLMPEPSENAERQEVQPPQWPFPSMDEQVDEQVPPPHLGIPLPQSPPLPGSFFSTVEHPLDFTVSPPQSLQPFLTCGSPNNGLGHSLELTALVQQSSQQSLPFVIQPQPPTLPEIQTCEPTDHPMPGLGNPAPSMSAFNPPSPGGLLPNSLVENAGTTQFHLSSYNLSQLESLPSDAAAYPAIHPGHNLHPPHGTDAGTSVQQNHTMANNAQALLQPQQQIFNDPTEPYHANLLQLLEASCFTSQTGLLHELAFTSDAGRVNSTGPEHDRNNGGQTTTFPSHSGGYYATQGNSFWP